jgi:hypothetical protein
MRSLAEGETDMGWHDFYRRRDALDTVLRLAMHDPVGPLPFAEAPGAEELFGDRTQLLLALHHRWSGLLTGRLRAELADPDDAAAGAGELGEDDRLDAVARAWRDTVARHPTLRAVLDTHVDSVPELLARHQAEQRTLAVTAGLAGAGEPEAEVTRVGAAFETLLRSGPSIPALRRRGPVGHLLRLLAPSA